MLLYFNKSMLVSLRYALVNEIRGRCTLSRIIDPSNELLRLLNQLKKKQ